MMLSSRRILAFLQGYLIIMIKGYNGEKLLNYALAEGITFWDVKRKTPKIILLKLRAADYPLLRPYFRKTETTGRILQKSGLPFLFRRVARKKGWLLGMVLFVIMLYLLSSFIWFVEVQGVQKLDKDLILRELSELGVSPGGLRSKIEKKRDWIIKELRIRLSDAVWVSIQFKGVVSLVTVAEKTLPPTTNEGDSNLIATKDGLITRILLIDGTPLVKEGDTVSRGDILVLGEKILQYLDGNLEMRKVKAEGEVIARVWYEVIIEEPLEVYNSNLTSDKRVIYSLKIKNQIIPLFSFGKITGRYQQERYRKTLFRGRNKSSLVELIKDIYQTANWNKRQVSTEMALNKARNAGNERITFLLPPGLKPVKREEEWEVKEEVLWYRLVVETLENIAKPALKEEQN